MQILNLENRNGKFVAVLTGGREIQLNEHSYLRLQTEMQTETRVLEAYEDADMAQRDSTVWLSDAIYAYSAMIHAIDSEDMETANQEMNLAQTAALIGILQTLIEK